MSLPHLRTELNVATCRIVPPPSHPGDERMQVAEVEQVAGAREARDGQRRRRADRAGPAGGGVARHRVERGRAADQLKPNLDRQRGVGLTGSSRPRARPGPSLAGANPAGLTLSRRCCPTDMCSPCRSPLPARPAEAAADARARSTRSAPPIPSPWEAARPSSSGPQRRAARPAQRDHQRRRRRPLARDDLIVVAVDLDVVRDLGPLGRRGRDLRHPVSGRLPPSSRARRSPPTRRR